MIDLKFISYDRIIDALDIIRVNRQPIKNFDINILETIPFKYVPFRINSDFLESWDTKKLNIKPSSTFADIYHETAHFILMSDYHSYYDFGLGSGFASEDTELNKSKFDQVFCDKQELMACMVEWSFMNKFNHSLNELSWILNHEDFIKFDLNEYNETFHEIMKCKPKFEKYGINLVG